MKFCVCGEGKQEEWGGKGGSSVALWRGVGWEG